MTKAWVKEYVETVSGTDYNKQDGDEFIKGLDTFYEEEKPMKNMYWKTQMTVTDRPDGPQTNTILHILMQNWQGLTYKTGELVDVTVTDMVEMLGDPNSKDDPDKVKNGYSWRLFVDDNPVGIWDWKGSSDEDRWSFYGHPTHVAKLFGEDHVRTR